MLSASGSWVRRRTRTIRLAAIAIGLLSQLAVAEQPRQHRTVTAGHLVVRTPERSLTTARTLATRGDRALADIGRDLGIPLPRRVMVLLYDNHQEFLGAGGQQDVPTAVGVALGRGVVLVDISLPWEPPEAVLKHELTHILVAEFLGGRVDEVPQWFHEGLAQVEAGPQTTGQVQQVLWAVRRGELMPLSQLTDDLPQERERLELAYAEANLFTAFLATKAKGCLGHILHGVREGKAFPVALEQATGAPLSLWENAWREELLRKGRRMVAGEVANGAALSIAALLVVLAYWRARRRGLRGMQSDSAPASEPDDSPNRQ